MEALELVLRLLEKVSVLVAAVLVLVLLRPAGVWLGEAGSQASVRRRLFLVTLLGGLAIWGTFLGFSVGGMRFNVRMVGIVVAGYLGGTWVGVLAGLAAGIIYALNVGQPMALYVLAASVCVGLLAGLWGRIFGTRFLSLVAGAVVIQVLYHGFVGGVMAAVDLQLATTQASNLTLHAAKITANAVGITLFMGVLEMVRELERAREVARESRDQLRTARLEALQYQVRPHFLFNLLNTLRYLIRTDPAKARELTLDLAEFLRYTLSRQENETTLREELVQIRRYVELERARFGDGLSFEVAPVPGDLEDTLLVPPLILQPLVENAIRHGAREGKVRVEVAISVEDDHVHVRVADDGPGPSLKADGASQGVGLQNVRERLARYYHDDVELVLRGRESGPGACAEFMIPAPGGPRAKGLAETAREKLRRVIG